MGNAIDCCIQTEHEQTATQPITKAGKELTPARKSIMKTNTPFDDKSPMSTASQSSQYSKDRENKEKESKLARYEEHQELLINDIEVHNPILQTLLDQIKDKLCRESVDDLSRETELTLKLLNCLTRERKIKKYDLNWLVFNNGIPNELKGLRQVVWRVLLGYFSDEDTSVWTSHQLKKKQEYDKIKKKTIVTDQYHTQANPDLNLVTIH